MGDRIIHDAETGEYIGEYEQGDRIVKGRSINSVRYQMWLDDVRSGKSEWQIKDFVKVSSQEQELWNKDLSVNEKAFLYSIQPYLSFDNDLVGKDGIQLNTEDVIHNSGLSRGTVNLVIHSLVKKFILYKGENGRSKQYFINPWIMCKGLYVDDVLKSHFRDYKIRIMNNRAWGSLRGLQK
jgi:hypothetical protein